MNLHQLRIFYTVARLGSFSRAAEELRISQPSVSIQVADLERSLRVDLFEQLGKRIYLTDAGRVLEDYARRILNLVEEANSALAEVAGEFRGRLTIGASTTPGTYVLPRVIGAFQEKYPNVTVTLDIANTRRIQERILRNELDLGIVGWEVSSHNLEVLPLLEDELVLVVPPGHQLAQAETVQAKVLRDQRVIMRERGSGTREAAEAALREAGVVLSPAMELGSNEAIKEAVAAGLGVTILSTLAVAPEVAARRLVVVPMDDLSIRRSFRVVYHRDKRMGKALRTFIDMLQSSVQTPA
ncbi:MAG TPA: selenium metabolism-associated LysR family transcriptional regulator [bacterium]|nr:selenium metabolism-associated LysR family transcriptional regulator [bacterium]